MRSDFDRLDHLENYGVPRFSSYGDYLTAELQSFCVHAEKRRQFRAEIDPNLLETVLDRSEDVFAKTKVILDEDFLSYKRICEIITQLNMDASPGLPFCRYYSNIGIFLHFDGVKVDPRRVHLLAMLFFSWLDNPVEYPFRVFIKDEPHKKSKIEAGRWRLIFSSPIMYQILEHALYDHLDNREAQLQWELPTKLSWNPFWGGASMARMEFYNPCSMDKEANDWLMDERWIEVEHRYRKRMIVAPPRFYELADLLYKFCFETATFAFSSGLVLKQNFVGINKSGLVTTLSKTTKMQWFIHQTACLECGHDHKGWFLGDDVLVSEPCDQYVTSTARMAKLKQVERNYHFCGFDLGTTVPLYWSKHYARLLYASDREMPDILDNYQRYYVYSPSKLALVQSLLAVYDHTKLRSEQNL